MIGEQFVEGDALCGIYVNIRAKGDRCELWTSNIATEAMQVITRAREGRAHAGLPCRRSPASRYLTCERASWPRLLPPLAWLAPLPAWPALGGQDDLARPEPPSPPVSRSPLQLSVGKQFKGFLDLGEQKIEFENFEKCALREDRGRGHDAVFLAAQP